MKTFFRVATTLAALSLSAGFALAHDYKAGTLEIRHPWSKATFKGAPVGGGYMSITNSGSEPDRLVKVTSDISGMIQIHEMRVQNGMMKMGQVPGGAEIKPGETVEFAPGGLHVMIMGLKAPLTAGEKIKATLTFEKAGDVPVEFSIEAVKPGAVDHSQHP